MEIIIAIASFAGLVGFAWTFIWAVKPDKPKAIAPPKPDEDHWRKEIEAEKKQDAVDWDAEYQSTMLEAWLDTVGITIENARKYVRTSRECVQLRTIIQAWENDSCSNPVETFTNRAMDGSSIVSYTRRCTCENCRVPEFRQMLEVKEGILRILDTEIKKRNPQFVSALDLDDKGVKMLESWEKVIPTGR